MNSAMVINLVGTIAGVLAAGFWLYSATIDVPNDIDTIVGQLQRIGRWNSYAAMAAVVAAVCASAVFARSLFH